MKKLLTVISGVLLCAFVLSGYATPHSTNFTTTNIASKENAKGTAPNYNWEVLADHSYSITIR